MALKGYSGSLRGIGNYTFLSGVGKGISDKICEILETGTCAKLQELEVLCPPPSIVEFQKLRGVGPVAARNLWRTYGATNLKQLQKLADKGKVADKDLLEALAFLAKERERIPLGVALPLVESIVGVLSPITGYLTKPAGSIRRMRDTVGDIDILTTLPVADAIKYLRRQFDITKVMAEGEKKAHIFFGEPHNLQIDIIHSEEDDFGAALLYLTGSRDFNIAMRIIAIKRGWSLSQYGLKSKIGGKPYHTSDEFKVFQKLGLVWVPPELREDAFYLDRDNEIPKLIEEATIDYHTHTSWSDGKLTVDEMVRLGIRDNLHHIGISDHSQSLKIAHGLTPERLGEQAAVIRKYRREYSDHIDIFHGSEVDINSDGSLDYPDEVLQQLDYVIAAIHMRPEKDVEQRLLKAISNPYTTIIAHPAGREFGRRSIAAINWDKVFRAAAEHHVAMEINCQPTRMDLPVDLIKHARQLGVKFAIGTDIHGGSREHVKFGLANARKAGLTKKDLLRLKPVG